MHISLDSCFLSMVVKLQKFSVDRLCGTYAFQWNFRAIIWSNISFRPSQSRKIFLPGQSPIITMNLPRIRTRLKRVKRVKRATKIFISLVMEVETSMVWLTISSFLHGLTPCWQSVPAIMTAVLKNNPFNWSKFFTNSYRSPLLSYWRKYCQRQNPLSFLSPPPYPSPSLPPAPAAVARALLRFNSRGRTYLTPKWQRLWKDLNKLYEHVLTLSQPKAVYIGAILMTKKRCRSLKKIYFTSGWNFQPGLHLITLNGKRTSQKSHGSTTRPQQTSMRNSA